MKRVYYILIAIFFIASSCSPVKVTTDFDGNVDFSKYKTVSFIGWQENIDQLLNDFDKERFRASFIAELEKRNLEIVADNGDMVASFFLVIDQKTSVTAYTNYYGGSGYGYGRAGWGWGGGHASTSYTESDYLEGTAVIDFFDQKSKDLIWQGVGIKTVQENPGQRDKTIPAAITTILKDFPIKPVK